MCKPLQEEPIFSTTDIYVRRLLKGQEPIFWFALPTDQLLICFHDKQSTYRDLWFLVLPWCLADSSAGLGLFGDSSAVSLLHFHRQKQFEALPLRFATKKQCSSRRLWRFLQCTAFSKSESCGVWIPSNDCLDFKSKNNFQYHQELETGLTQWRVEARNHIFLFFLIFVSKIIKLQNLII